MISCRHDPKILSGAPMGMYHCPDCGTMVLAGLAHPNDEDCRFMCADWEAPEYEETS